MAKMTLLEMVQDILSEMDSDEVNSLSDTVESEQVAQILRTTYAELMSNRNWPHLAKLIQFNSSTDINLPTHQTLGADVKELLFVRYDCRKTGITKRDYKDMKYLAPLDFLTKTNARDSDSANVLIVNDPTSVEVLVLNDKAPEYFTSFDEETLVFDSYDSNVGSTLITDRFQCQAYVMPQWVHEDDAYPDLPSEAFSALLEEAKSVCFHTLKQVNNDKAEQKARRQQRWLSQKAWAVSDLELYPDFGRKPIGSRNNPYIRKD